ncbi:MAG: NAD(P)H-dependent oxidoreductase subunit E [Verrucomicrobia bacterium]|nr:NAD(P)H-dependent oxidoreductase subunit E [Verrucomicrobiota bacterium]MCH8513008.1 NAD(P)H-dependent oxidoreductase subunit E [Kiritimatiellia bacterium]
MQTQTELGKLLEWVEIMRGRIREIVREWADQEGNLIMMLHAIQNEFGYISRGAAGELAKETGISMARIYEVITFYHYFRVTPPGKHTLQVCMGTACYLKGAAALHKELERQLGILAAAGGGHDEFQLETVRCIGCCGMAPAVVVDAETHGRLCPGDMAQILHQKQKA